MALVERSVLVGYPARSMYALVDGVERYPEFLPWCGEAHVESREGALTRASLTIDYHGIKQRFKTENRSEAPHLIEIKLVSGPFRTLDGTWRFHALGEQGCRVELRLHYEFSSRVLEKLVGPVFNGIATSLVDAFVKRAEQLHAAR